MEENNNQENKIPEENSENIEESKEKDNSTIFEKAEDVMDNVMGGIQDFIYGEQNDPNTDIPVTIEKPSGIRKVNKIQTRRNFNKWLFGKKGKWIFLGIVAFAIIIGLIVSFVG